jgi:hypothetical protein
MAESTKSLFHYTRKFDNLAGIIKHGFKYSSLSEELPFTASEYSFFSIFNDTDLIKYLQNISCICFCDIPIDRIEDHKYQYGQYCIGMSKEWAIENGITPVRYIHKSTPDIKHETYKMITKNLLIYDKHYFDIIELIAHYLKERDKSFKFSVCREWLEGCPIEGSKIFANINAYFSKIIILFLLSIRLLKSYKGTWKDRVTNVKTERIFYNEREWRSLKQHDEHNFLTFKFEDINHIIVLTNE